MKPLSTQLYIDIHVRLYDLHSTILGWLSVHFELYVWFQLYGLSVVQDGCMSVDEQREGGTSEVLY